MMTRNIDSAAPCVDLMTRLCNKRPDFHVPALPGDYVEDGYLHCGTCRSRKEYRFRHPSTGLEMVQPSLCQCGIRQRNADEARIREREAIARCDALKPFQLVDLHNADASFENASIDSVNRAAFQIARSYTENIDAMVRDNCGLLFYGQPGTGKTYLAACIAHALNARNIPVLFTGVSKLAETRDLSETLAVMARAQVLILDDFGTERNTPYMAERVYRIINERYNRNKPLILTTNLGSFSDPGNMDRQRVFDRINELCRPVQMTGESRRKALGDRKRRSAAQICAFE